MKRLALLASLVGTSAAAHDGAHLHPHDGASWFVVLGALGVLALAGALARSAARSRG